MNNQAITRWRAAPIQPRRTPCGIRINARLFTRSVPARAAALLLLLGLAGSGPALAQLAPPPPLKPALSLDRKLPTPTAMPLEKRAPTAIQAGATTQARSCEDDCLLSPARPWRFELFAGERTSSGFAVTQPGPVRVEVQAAGVPLLVTLRRPNGRLIERQGSGTIVIDDAASAADVDKGVLWGVGVRAAQEPARATAATLTAGVVPRAVAGGTLSVQHPPVDAERAKAALKQAAAQAASQRPQAPPAPPVDARSQAAQAQAAHDKRVAVGHAAVLSKLQPTVPAQVHTQISQRIDLRVQGQTLQQASAAAPVRLVKAEAKLKPATLGMSAGFREVVEPGLLGSKSGSGSGSGSAQGAATGGAAPVGSGGGAAAAAPAAAPVLAGLSTTEGDPGTPLTLSGSDFGGAPGEVHFIVGNGRDVAAPITYWSGDQIVTEVPYADGLPVYDGHVYVKRGDGVKTALRPFRFLPLYDVAVIGLPITQASGEFGRAFDVRLGGGALGVQTFFMATTPTNGTVNRWTGLLFGDRGDDQFYLGSRLKNGWLVVGASLGGLLGAVGGPTVRDSRHAWASIVDWRPGTDSPYLKVHWWADGGDQQVIFSAFIVVQRPKNLPCSATPCPVL